MDRNELVAAQSSMWCPLYPLQLLSKSDRMVAIAIYPVVLVDLTTYTADKYDNADWWKLARTGGVTQVIVGEDGIGRGNGGVPLACRGCWIQVLPGQEGVWISKEGDEFDGIGPYIPGAAEGCQPIFLPISDVSKIIVEGGWGTVADIVYLLG